VNFKIDYRPLFTIIFKLKKDNFKTRDFSPLIERVLAGVWEILSLEEDMIINRYFQEIFPLTTPSFLFLSQ
jgi:hypothetical protein